MNDSGEIKMSLSGYGIEAVIHCIDACQLEDGSKGYELTLKTVLRKEDLIAVLQLSEEVQIHAYLTPPGD